MDNSVLGQDSQEYPVKNEMKVVTEPQQATTKEFSIYYH